MQIGVVGHFGNGLNLLNGQTIKTKIVAAELERVFGEDDVWKIDTHGGLKLCLKLPLLLFLVLLKCKNVIIMPAQNGLLVIPPLLHVLNFVFRRKIHYVVVGGWMPNLISKRPFLTHCLKRFNQICVETSIVKEALENRHFSNVKIMQNCKPLQITPVYELKNNHDKVFRLCLFSRVMKQKGVEHAVAAVAKLSCRFGKDSCCLDIYGQIESSETEWFDKLQESFPDNVVYKGVVPFDKSTSVLKGYTALLFPTLFFTEGVPGTIIDAYAAGLPVISSRWASFSDVVEEGKTGFGYDFGSFEQLCILLENLICFPEKLDEMRVACVEKARSFLPKNAMKNFIDGMR